MSDRPRRARGDRRSIVFLFAVAVILSGLNLFWTSHETSATAARIARGQAAQAAAAHRAARLEIATLCATFGKLGQLHPPAGNPATNPSRAYLQGQARVLDELGADLGCHR